MSEIVLGLGEVSTRVRRSLDKDPLTKCSIKPLYADKRADEIWKESVVRNLPERQTKDKNGGISGGEACRNEKKGVILRH